MMKRTILLLVCLFPLCLRAQEAEDNTFGGWEFIEVNHDFGKGPFFGTFYFEHDNYQYRRLECWYTRTTLGVKVLPWLKADVAYDYLQEPSFHTHKLNLDLTGTLKSGNLKVAVRERYVHSWTPALGEEGNVLRSSSTPSRIAAGVRTSRWRCSPGGIPGRKRATMWPATMISPTRCSLKRITCTMPSTGSRPNT